jgi:hypothetical protein
MYLHDLTEFLALFNHLHINLKIDISFGNWKTILSKCGMS